MFDGAAAAGALVAGPCTVMAVDYFGQQDLHALASTAPYSPVLPKPEDRIP